jgi:polysaccharide biosynthesis protein PslG
LGAILLRILTSTLVIVLTILASSCAGVAGSPNSLSNPTTQSISLSPAGPSVRAGAAQQFTTSVVGIRNPQLTWSVNGVPGGNAAAGVISSTGTLTASYTAPPIVPAPATVTIKASVTSNGALTAMDTANLLNAVPQLFSASPSKFSVGSFSITVSGSSFVSGAVVDFGGIPLATNFVSPTELTATGTATISEGGNVQITVTNPNPGSATSGSVTAQVLRSTQQAPQISVSPTALTIPTGGIADASLTVTGSPTPTVICVVSGAGTAQLSGSTVSYTAPNTVPENGPAIVSCTATNAAGSAAASFTANISTIVPGYVGAVPSTYFAMHIIEPQDWPTVPVGALGKLTGSLWPYVEPTKGQYIWTRVDAFVDTASAHGISIMYSNDGVPPWAVADSATCFSQPYFGPYCSGAVANLQDWDDFVAALVTRYKGRIQIYELWNEPENTFTGTRAQFVAMMQHEHDIIRALDPGASILSPSMVSQGYSYLDSYFAAGGTTDIDAVAIHTYPDQTNDVAESITTSITTTIRTVMSKYGLSATPLWGTEGSWGVQSAGDIIDPNLRTAFIAREYLLAWSMGISRFYWYAWDSIDVGTLWSPASAPSEPAVAYEQVYKWMNGATMSQACSLDGGGTAYHAVYTCGLTRSGGYQALAVWNTDGASIYAAPVEYLHYLDLQGNTVAVPANHQVPVGLQPILLENK